MTNFEKAVEIAVRGIRHDAKLYGVNLDECDGWADMLDWFGQDSADMKNDIYRELFAARRNGEIDFAPMDDCSIEDSDGSVKTYRQLTNAVRKQLFA